jgi:very-short-patch-repair endonuclease
MSLPERMLWALLRRSPGGISFRRQHPDGPYTIDFYCAAAGLAIEIDGKSHDMGDRPVRDERKIDWLGRSGFEVVRIEAVDVLRDAADVADRLWRLAAERALRAPSTTRLPPSGPPPHAAHGEDD